LEWLKAPLGWTIFYERKIHLKFKTVQLHQGQSKTGPDFKKGILGLIKAFF
jgi:hypothetical protein